MFNSNGEIKMKYIIFEFDDTYTREQLEKLINQTGFERTALYNNCIDIKIKEESVIKTENKYCKICRFYNVGCRPLTKEKHQNDDMPECYRHVKANTGG